MRTYDLTETSDDTPPKIHVRWFQVEVPELLTIAPLVLNSTISWRPLTREESDACESARLALPAPSKSRPASPADSSRSQTSTGVVEGDVLPPGGSMRSFFDQEGCVTASIPFVSS